MIFFVVIKTRKAVIEFNVQWSCLSNNIDCELKNVFDLLELCDPRGSYLNIILINHCNFS